MMKWRHGKMVLKISAKDIDKLKYYCSTEISICCQIYLE